MTRLYIDDIRNPPDDDWIITHTITGAIRVLATMEVDTIGSATQVMLDGKYFLRKALTIKAVFA
jgi:hypothetical protein